MSTPRVFDMAHYETLNPARAEPLTKLLSELKDPLKLRTAIDVGCGLGYFSALLQSFGLEVTGVDGRRENAEEAARRVPRAKFHSMNAEDASLRKLGHFDITLCFGLLYHLENPFVAIRHLRAVTDKLLLIESVIFPGSEPVMAFVDEGPSEDQGLNHIAFYPTGTCLVKMIYQAGFAFVYSFPGKPDHPDFQNLGGEGPIRIMLAASHASLESQFLKNVAEPRLPYDPWNSAARSDASKTLLKMHRFVKKPLAEKIQFVKRIVKPE